jgi:hypothetical protein
VSVTLVGALLAAVALTTRTASRSYEQGRHRDQLGTRADRALERLADEFGDAERAGLLPEPLEPWGSSFLAYRHATGFVDGEVVFGTTTEEGSVVSTVNAGLPDEQRTVLARGVPRLLEGELENGEDDNQNGLIDEPGLSFVAHEDVLTIRLTLQSVGPEGQPSVRTVETSVRMRN